MAANPYKFRLYSQGRTGRCALGFITGPDLNAAEFFDNLDETGDREFRERFDYWLGGAQYKKYFHGWDAPEFRECFVFKRQTDRLFGFKCHPSPKTEKRLQLCALTYHGEKEGEEADHTALRRVNRLRADGQVIQAIRAIYKEYGT